MTGSFMPATRGGKTDSERPGQQGGDVEGGDEADDDLPEYQ